MLSKLCACLINVSEAKKLRLIESISKAAVVHAGNGRFMSVLNVFRDEEYNRSVITIAATPDTIGESVIGLCTEGFRQIDLSKHEGIHPRLGSIDLVTVHPLTEETSLEECGEIARDIADSLSTRVAGTSFFLFGSADPLKRGLVERRNNVKWYSGDLQNARQDIGSTPSRRYGLTGIGASPYVMNCNVTIETQDLKIGQIIAREIRASSCNGLPGVQAMAFPHEGNVEIGCNVVCFPINENIHEYSKGLTLLKSFGNVYYVSPDCVRERIAQMANSYRIETKPHSIVGLTPSVVKAFAEEAFRTKQYELWKTRQERMM